MAKAGVYHTDINPTEIDMLEAITFSAENINVGIITANSGIYTSIVSNNINVGIITATNISVGIITANRIGINSGIATLSNLTVGISSITDSPPSNYQLKFYLLSNNQLTISVRGSDGNVRTGIVSLT